MHNTQREILKSNLAGIGSVMFISNNPSVIIINIIGIIIISLLGILVLVG